MATIAGTETAIIEQSINANISIPVSTAGWAQWQLSPGGNPVVVVYPHEPSKMVRVYVPSITGQAFTVLSTPSGSTLTFTRPVLMPHVVVTANNGTPINTTKWYVDTYPSVFDGTTETVSFSRARVKEFKVTVASDGISVGSGSTAMGSVIGANIPLITNLTSFEFNDIDAQALPSSYCTGIVQMARGVELTGIPEESNPTIIVGGQQYDASRSTQTTMLVADYGEVTQMIETIASPASSTPVWISPCVSATGSPALSMPFQSMMIPPDAMPYFEVNWTWGPSNTNTTMAIKMIHVFAYVTTTYDVVLNTTTYAYHITTEAQEINETNIGVPFSSVMQVASTSTVSPPSPDNMQRSIFQPQGVNTMGSWIGSYFSWGALSSETSIYSLKMGTRCKRTEWGPVRVASIKDLGAQQAFIVTGKARVEAEITNKLVPYVRQMKSAIRESDSGYRNVRACDSSFLLDSATVPVSKKQRLSY
jgi:hypothetical protein